MFKDIIIDGVITNYQITDDGKVFNKKTKKELKGTLKRNEYKTVQLNINNKIKTYMVHRLVAITFLDNPNDLPIVHHKDGNKLNNNINNLEWVNHKDNLEPKNKKKKTIKVNEIIVDDINCKIIKNHPNYAINFKGEVFNLKTKHKLTGSVRNGYVRVGIDGKLYSVHRLVYETFLGEIKGEVDHIDGNKSNNDISNLRDTTRSENMLNSMKKGHGCQVTVHQYTKDNIYIQDFSSCSEAARKYGVTPTAIRSAALRDGTSCGYKWKF